MEKVQILASTFSATKNRLVFLTLALLSFVISFSFEGSQWLVGTVVNFTLFASASLFSYPAFLPFIILPSTATLARGLIFGHFTPFLLYFLPFIWLGNLILVLTFKKFSQRFGDFWAMGLAGFLKFLMLFLASRFLFRLNLVPPVFLTVMGINQLITAFSGGFLNFLVPKTFYGTTES